MNNILGAFERLGMTLTEFGEGLGYDGPTEKTRVVPSLSHVRPTHFDRAGSHPCAGGQDWRFNEVIANRRAHIA